MRRAAIPSQPTNDPCAASRPTRPRLRVPTRIGLALILAVLWIDAPASAHGRSLSYSTWTLTPEGGEVTVRISLLELSRLGIPLPLEPGTSPRDAAAAGEYLAEHLELRDAGGPCQPLTEPTRRRSADGWVSYHWSLRCGGAQQRQIRSSILLEAAPSHLHFARILLELPPDDPTAEANAGAALERVLSESSPSWKLMLSGEGDADSGDIEGTGTSFASYLVLGTLHILSGWDHLAFVLVLILLATRFGEVARLVTGFTLAHSLTLVLAVLGLVRPEPAAVEAIIGFSVALLAAENTWLLTRRGAWIPILSTASLLTIGVAAVAGLGTLSPLALLGLALFSACHFSLLSRARDATTLRVLVAFAFGLVHGFGFAGVLAEMNLPASRLVPALVGFNLGVEVGQLAVVALIWPILMLLMRSGEGRPYRRFAEVCSAAVCGIGIYWFLTRAFDGGV